jgi:ketosteroid isomerase-like protein
MKVSVFSLLFCSLFVVTPCTAQSVADEVRATFEKFVEAQNAHNAKTVESLLSDSPTFLWITRGNVVWGRADAVKRFETLYQGTWHLEPEFKDFKVVLDQPKVAQIFVPIVFSIGPAGQAAQESRFLMNQTMVRAESGWKIASILPIPSSPPAPAPASQK